MLAYYRFSGVLANIALLVNVIVLFGAMGMFGVVLTLPGIAGIILTVGMAIDANVLIYERIREELAEGKSMQSAGLRPVLTKHSARSSTRTSPRSSQR